MVQAGLVHHVATEDMDALTFKTTSLLRRLTMPEARKLSVQELSYEKTLKMLGLEHEEFVDLCILLGCDYVPNIKVSIFVKKNLILSHSGYWTKESNRIHSEVQEY